MTTKTKKKEIIYGSICGGVVSESLFNSNPWAYMMGYSLPDKQFKKYVAYKKAGKDKEATKIFERYAHDHIG